MIFTEKKLQKLKTENVRKKLKTSQGILRILSRIKNDTLGVIISSIYSHSNLNYNKIEKSFLVNIQCEEILNLILS